MWIVPSKLKGRLPQLGVQFLFFCFEFIFCSILLNFFFSFYTGSLFLEQWIHFYEDKLRLQKQAHSYERTEHYHWWLQRKHNSAEVLGRVISHQIHLLVGGDKNVLRRQLCWTMVPKMVSSRRRPASWKLKLWTTRKKFHRKQLQVKLINNYYV